MTEGPTGVFSLDGISDLVCRVDNEAVAWPAAGSNVGAVNLMGALLDGTPIGGSDHAALAGEPTCQARAPIGGS